MSLTDMQHQYWVTKQTVLRKLGGKEDECVVSSDAELDAKLELFRSVADSCVTLQRVIDQYQERLCVLAQEENTLGRFLKDASKQHESVGKHMSAAGKALTYLGQQRIQLRAPLVRLHHEVDTFRARAVADTRSTLCAMERARTEYRADLKWMKAASGQLDPDTGRGLEKFRKAQNQTRQSKLQFDRLTLDCLEKVDLLAAARCNMFSHALIQYQSSILSFFTRSTQTLQSAVATLGAVPQYNFCVLKELSQQQSSSSPTATETDEAVKNKDDGLADEDQLLFFQDDYTDEKIPDEDGESKKPQHNNKSANVDSTIEGESFSKEAADLLGLMTSRVLEEKRQLAAKHEGRNLLEEDTDYDLLGLLHSSSSGEQSAFMSSDLLEDLLPLDLNFDLNSSSTSLIRGGGNDLLLSSKSSAMNHLQSNNDNDDDGLQPLSGMSGIFFDNGPSSSLANLISSASTVHHPACSSSKKASKATHQDVMSPMMTTAAAVAAASGKSNTSSNRPCSDVPPRSKQKLDRKDVSQWLKLFSDLDPLANPDSLMSGTVQNSHST